MLTVRIPPSSRDFRGVRSKYIKMLLTRKARDKLFDVTLNDNTNSFCVKSLELDDIQKFKDHVNSAYGDYEVSAQDGWFEEEETVEDEEPQPMIQSQPEAVVYSLENVLNSEDVLKEEEPVVPEKPIELSWISLGLGIIIGVLASVIIIAAVKILTRKNETLRTS